MSCYSGDRPLTNNMKTSVLKDQLSAMKKQTRWACGNPVRAEGDLQVYEQISEILQILHRCVKHQQHLFQSHGHDCFGFFFLYSLYLLSLQCFLSFCQETNFTEFQKCNHQPLVEKDEQEEKININPISKKVGNAAITIIMEPMICL